MRRSSSLELFIPHMILQLDRTFDPLRFHLIALTLVYIHIYALVRLHKDYLTLLRQLVMRYDNEYSF